MLVAGLQKTTLLDFPGLVASTIFTYGCNMRCPFCHNMDLVNGDISALHIYDEEEIIRFLKKRSGIIEGVCITGGEPTLQTELPDFIARIKSLGLKVKLDTNGTNPGILEMLVNKKTVDYIAMDVKSSMAEYKRACGSDNIDTDKISQSIEFLINSQIDYEFRTTIVNELHDAKIMEDIGRQIEGAKKYYLQSFVDSEYVPNHGFTAVSDEKLKEFQGIVRKYVTEVEIRGRDVDSNDLNKQN